jgi:hypothetical protein
MSRAPRRHACAHRRARTNCIFFRKKRDFIFRAEEFPRRRGAPTAPLARFLAQTAPPPNRKYFCKMVDIQKSRD